MTKTRNSCLLDKVPRACNFCLLTSLGLHERVDPILKKVILNVEIYSGNHKVSNFLVTGHYRGDYGSISFIGVFHFLPFLGPFSNFGLFFILGHFCIFGWSGGLQGGSNMVLWPLTW